MGPTPRLQKIVNESCTSKDNVLVELMHTYGQKIVRLAFTYVKNRETAEDIAQEVFIKCYEKLDQLEEKSSLNAWIYRITVNCCKDYLKSWSYRHIQASQFITTLIGENAPSPELRLIDRTEHEQLVQHILSLPVKYREVIILYYYEELTVDEISNLLQTRKNTIRTRLFRARELLKKRSF